MPTFKTGMVAILGYPNVGKSTLLNALLGEKLAAVSSKPQTTRHRILGIKNRPDGQILFLDTPGIHRPHKTLGKIMMETVRSVVGDADLFLVMVEAPQRNRGDRLEGVVEIVQMIRDRKKPIVIAVNKIDQMSKLSLLPVLQYLQDTFGPDALVPISAKTSDGLDRLETEIIHKLPEGPALFPGDQLSDVSERFLAAEVIREKVIELTKEEVPYSVAVVIEDYREPREEDSKKIVRIRAIIVVERDSQKGILIGQGGQMIKKIGQLSRIDLEARLGCQVFLELIVRVEPQWTHDPHKVRELVA